MKVFKGIIIHSTDYLESDKILNIATLEAGIITVVAKGVRKPNAKLKSLVSIFTFGDFVVREGKSRYILNGVEPIELFYNCWTDPFRYGAGVLVLEVYQKLSQNQLDVKDFMLLLRELEQINYADSYPLVFALHFLVKIGESVGVDVSFLKENKRQIYDMLLSIKDINPEELGALEILKNEVLDGLKLMSVLYKNHFGININSLQKIFEII